MFLAQKYFDRKKKQSLHFVCYNFSYILTLTFSLSNLNFIITLSVTLTHHHLVKN